MTLVLKDTPVIRPLEPYEFEIVLDAINAELAMCASHDPIAEISAKIEDC